MWDLVPQPGIEPGPPALGAQSLSHRTVREVPNKYFLRVSLCQALCRVTDVVPDLRGCSRAEVQTRKQLQLRAQGLGWDKGGRQSYVEVRASD